MVLIWSYERDRKKEKVLIRWASLRNTQVFELTSFQ